jgi:hypothetical protein
MVAGKAWVHGSVWFQQQGPRGSYKQACLQEVVGKLCGGVCVCAVHSATLGVGGLQVLCLKFWCVVITVNKTVACGPCRLLLMQLQQLGGLSVSMHLPVLWAAACWVWVGLTKHCQGLFTVH